jgi:hypothetical protein
VGAWTKKLYDHFSDKITSNDPENSIQKKSPVFVFPSEETNVNVINTGDQQQLIANIASTSTNSETRNSSLNHNSVGNRRFSRSFEEIKTQKFANEEVISVDRPLEIRLDGPYGSPSRHIFDSQHAVLVATGIGVRKI